MAFLVTLLVLASAIASVAGDEMAVLTDSGDTFTVRTYGTSRITLSFESATPNAFTGWWESALHPDMIEIWYRDGGGNDHKLADFTPPVGDHTSWTLEGVFVGPFVSLGPLIMPDEQVHLTLVDVTGGGFSLRNHNFPANGWSFVPGCVTQCGDPHFQGLDGVKYDFQGKHNKAFAVISEPTVELNSFFVSAGPQRSYVNAVCLRVCNDTLVIKSPHTVHYNGEQLPIGGHASATSFAVQRPHKNRIEVVIPQKWTLSFNLGGHVDIDEAVPLHEYNGKTHGVLGHTMKHRDSSIKHKCNKHNEGGCEVEGAAEDYIVPGDDLCGTAWKHSQFDADLCV